MEAKSLSTRTFFLLISLFGIVIYSNTVFSSFQFDDILAILENRSIYPIDLVRLWRYHPLRFLTNLSFTINIYFSGFHTWSFHILNILIHILASWTVFKLTRLLLRTPAMKDKVPSTQQDLFALAVAMIFLVHPVQTQAVTYIVQRATSLAALFYLAALVAYLRARLENTSYYWDTAVLMFMAMITKEISFTLPFAILLIELFFFRAPGTESLRKKFIRWIPFTLFFLVIPLLYLHDPHLLIRARGSLKGVPTLLQGYPRGLYFLTECRVLVTYLRLLICPINQSLIYDYRLTKSFTDLESWNAVAGLLTVLLAALFLFKKHRLLSFGIFWFFLVLSVESSVIPLPDVIFEHRLYLAMFGFAVFLTSLSWTLIPSPKIRSGVLLLTVLTLSGMAYARNEIWKNAITLFSDAVKKAPRLGITYAGLADGYNNELGDLRRAVFYYEKAMRLGFATPTLFHYLSTVYATLGNKEKSLYYKKKIASVQYRERNLLFPDSRAAELAEEGRNEEVVKTLKNSIALSPDNSMLQIQLGEIYLKMNRDHDAVQAFQDAIKTDPLFLGCYNVLAFYYKSKGEEEKAIETLAGYFRTRRIHQPLFGSLEIERGSAS